MCVRRSKERIFLKIKLSVISLSITVKPEQIQPEVLSPLQAQNERAIHPPDFILSWSIRYKQLKTNIFKNYHSEELVVLWYGKWSIQFLTCMVTKRSIMYIKIAFLGGFWYLNIHCIRKSITAELLAAAYPDGSESPSLIKKYQSWAKSFDTFKRKCQATIIIKVAGWSQNKTEAKQNNIHSNKEPKCSPTNSHQPTRLFWWCCLKIKG